MAEEAIKKLEEQLNCPVCLSTYTEPKQLQCFHIYCLECLLPLLSQDQRGQSQVKCPNCRQITLIPDKGVAGLPTAFHINHLLDILKSLQKADQVAAVHSPEKATQTLRNVASHCYEHPEEDLKLFCVTCKALICLKCAIKGGSHYEHTYEDLEITLKKCDEKIASLVDSLENQEVAIRTGLESFKGHCCDLNDQHSASNKDIRVAFKQLHHVLEERENRLIDELQQVTQEKVEELAACIDKTQTNLAKVVSCHHYVRESFTRTGGKFGVLVAIKKDAVKRASELLAQVHNDSLNPEMCSPSFLASADMVEKCQAYGKIVIPNLLDVSKCRVITDGNAVMGKKSSAILRASDSVNKPYEKPIESLECELKSEISGITAICSVEKKEKGQYKISYLPIIKGRHQLHIKAEGQHVKGSPFSIMVMSKGAKLCTLLHTLGRIDCPWGVAIIQSGEVVVTDGGRHCVSIFSPSGDLIRSFGSHGSGEGQFRNPLGVAVDEKGNIVVADHWNHRIQMFTAEGKFLRAVGSKGYSDLKFSLLKDVAYNSKNHKWYALDHHVQVFNSDLTLAGSFGKEGSSKGEFSSPCSIACDPTGRVYVADGGNNRVQVFTAEGEFLQFFTERYEMIWPHSIAIDARGIVYVSEHSCISVFTSKGHLQKSFEVRRHYPLSLAADKSGILYVCDVSNDCVFLMS